MSSSTDPGQAPEACGYSDFLDIMRGLPLFAKVPLEVSKVLAYLSRLEEFQPGDYLVREGEHAETFYYVTCGSIVVSRMAGGEPVVLRRFGPGECLGGLALILGGRSLFTLQAESQTSAMTLGREQFLKTVQRFPQVEPAMLQSLAEHVLAWEERFLTRHPEQFAQFGQDFGLTLY
ncbi:MAG: Crp/Fnr family transcriptional regulator [Acidobacteriota bacterium]